MNKNESVEPQAVVERYSRRNVGDRYSMLRPEVWLSLHERQAAILQLLSKHFPETNLADLKLLEVGSGEGGNLLDFLRFGFAPQNLCGLELLPERIAAAKKILPTGLSLYEGDACAANISSNSQDVVFQAVVFSSILDKEFQEKLAERMWQWVEIGGGVLWYDFIYNNPGNADVCGVSVSRIRELFPNGKITIKRVTLAPPISRRVCRIHHNAYHLFNMIPLLRTHVLCWIQKTS